MNLTQPPFDDVHVRRAVNFVVDREALRKAWGGPPRARVATHIAPDAMLVNTLKGYAPYGANGSGNLAKAKAEMKLSKYDTNHDGICDAKACKNVFTSRATRPVEEAFIPVLEQNLKSIGITLKDHVLKDAYTPIGDAAPEHPVLDRPGWGKDYADPSTFFDAALRRRNIIPQGNTNYSLVGITPRQAKKVGVKGNVTERAERQRRPRQLQRPLRRRPRVVLRGARQEAHDDSRAVGAVPVVERDNRSRARTSRSGTSTSSAAPPRTPTWRSSDLTR